VIKKQRFEMPVWLTLIITGLAAGFIDSIAGGGGLITVPALMLLVGPGAHAIGTNKVAALVAAGVALLVYVRAGHMDWRRAISFTFCVAAGSFCGSLVTPSVPAAAFRWFLAVTCPLVLWILWRKDFWISSPRAAGSAFGLPILLSGLACGFYDGLWGPGGGTFMFLSLLVFGKVPLLGALAASKLANTASALSSLTGYTLQGYVHWVEGAFLALGIGTGAFFGARTATHRASRIVRPVLTIVVVLLVLTLFRELW
jgi:uncharacterized protein